MRLAGIPVAEAGGRGGLHRLDTAAPHARVEARELHRPRDAQAVVQRRHRDVGVLERERVPQRGRRIGIVDAVALAGLHGQPRSQVRGDAARGRSGREHDGVALERLRLRAHGLDSPVRGLEARHRLVGDDVGQLREQRRGERDGFDLAIGLVLERIADARRERGFDLVELRPLERLRDVPEPREHVVVRSPLLEALPVFVGEQDAAAVLLERDAVRGPLVEQLEAGRRQREVELEAAEEVPRRAVARHREHEADERRRGRRPHVERAVGIEHPLDPLHDHARARYRRRLGERDLRRAPGSRAEPGLDAVDHRDVVSIPGQLVGDAEPDDAAAHDDYAHPFSGPATMEQALRVDG